MKELLVSKVRRSLVQLCLSTRWSVNDIDAGVIINRNRDINKETDRLNSYLSDLYEEDPCLGQRATDICVSVYTKVHTATLAALPEWRKYVVIESM